MRTLPAPKPDCIKPSVTPTFRVLERSTLRSCAPARHTIGPCHISLPASKQPQLLALTSTGCSAPSLSSFCNSERPRCNYQMIPPTTSDFDPVDDGGSTATLCDYQAYRISYMFPGSCTAATLFLSGFVLPRFIHLLMALQCQGIPCSNCGNPAPSVLEMALSEILSG